MTHFAFVWDGDIYLANRDASKVNQLTEGPEIDYAPAFSPDKSKIAFARFVESPEGNSDVDVYTINADGSGLTQLTDSAAYEYQPAWSPRGDRIAFVQNLKGNDEVFVMDSDGGNQTRLTYHPLADESPSWSPDGSRIAFSRFTETGQQIFVMGADGSGASAVTNGPSDRSPSWSPSGASIAFAKADASEVKSELAVLDLDSGSVEVLTATPEEEEGRASWLSVDELLLTARVSNDGDSRPTYRLEALDVTTGEMKRLLGHQSFELPTEPSAP